MAYQRFKNVEVGDQFYINNPAYGKHQPTYTGPFPVIKVTSTQITLDQDGKKVRFLKTTGHKVGSKGWRSLKIECVTPELTARIERDRELIEKKMAEEAAANRAKEVEQRKKFNCNHIVAEDIQRNWLAPLRKMVETGEGKVENVLKRFEGVSIQKGNYFHVAREMERSVECGDVEYGSKLVELASELHTDLCIAITDYSNGDRFECDGVEINDCDALCRAKVQYAYDRMCDRFFNYSFASQEIAAADQRFLSELRSMLGIQYKRKSINRIKVDDAVA